MEEASGFEEINLRTNESTNDFAKETDEKLTIMTVIGFLGFGFVIFAGLFMIIKDPFVKMFSFSTENDAIPGVASHFGLVFAVFWFVCATLLFISLVFKTCYTCLKKA